jgi:hypothetical protein
MKLLRLAAGWGDKAEKQDSRRKNDANGKASALPPMHFLQGHFRLVAISLLCAPVDIHRLALQRRDAFHRPK